MKNMRISELAQALYTVNRHAKTALQPQHLYWIKKQTINKLLQEKHAKKVGLHFSDNPKFSNQHSTLLVKVADYYFHVPPSKVDFQNLEHLGNLDQSFRNPPSKMSLSQAKRIVYQYIDWQPEKNERHKQSYNKPSYFTPSSLGKMEWPPSKKGYQHKNRAPKKPK